MRFIEANGRRWVLRIYETHKDAEKIKFEHEILLVLSECSLPFQVPVPVKCEDGSTVVELEDGTGRLACLFHYIEGHRPEEGSTEIAYTFGAATGQLSVALASLKVEGKPMYPPYYEMDSAHPLCMPSKVAEFCFNPPTEFQGQSAALRVIGEAIQNFRGYLPQFRELPHQLIHGDINYSNSLVSESESDGKCVAAILDFEFCTRDLRVMELAVIVSGFLTGELALDNIEGILSGFGEQLQLERAEVEAIPLLVQLRILDVFLHFLGRYLDGVDGESVLKEQTLYALDGLRQLEKVEGEILGLSFQYLTTK
ncbi:phosphotransferase [Cohnella sp. NL03-T5]|nr:phosphotransferase [Cohnella silvisoli]